jgi:hypothetical protein
VRLEAAHDHRGLHQAQRNAASVHEVAPIQITTQLARLDGGEAAAGCLRQRALGPGGGAHEQELGGRLVRAKRLRDG